MIRITSKNITSLKENDVIKNKEDLWSVIKKLSSELEIGKSLLMGASITTNMKKKVSYDKLFEEEWFKLEEDELTHK